MKALPLVIGVYLFLVFVIGQVRKGNEQIQSLTDQNHQLQDSLAQYRAPEVSGIEINDTMNLKMEQK